MIILDPALILKEGMKMKVSMLTETSWDGRFLHIKDEIEVPYNIGQRWCNRKIAAAVGGTVLNPDDKTKTLTITELKIKAKQLEIDGYTKMNKEQLVVTIAEAEELKVLQAKARSFGVTSVDTMTKEELEEAIFLGAKAIELNIQGHETMTKEQLIEAIAEKTKLNESNRQA